MAQHFAELTGFVLAGGQSRRMGRPKHELRIGEETLLSRQIRLLSQVAGRVAILAAPELVSGSEIPAYADELPGHGPLGGIYTGLLRTRTENNIFLACDLPFIGLHFIRYLLRRARCGHADVLIPESRDGRLQPLCAVYRRRVRGAIRASLLLGQNHVTGFLPRVRWEALPFREIASAGFPAAMLFDNVNTPEDYDTARRVLARPVGSGPGEVGLTA